MALPVSITGISTAVAAVGPFATTSSAFVTTSPAPNISNATGDDATRERRAQSFTVGSSNITVTSVNWVLIKVGSPTDNWFCDLFAVASGTPSGTALATSNAVAAATISATASAINFTFASPATLTASTLYCAVLRRSGAIDAVNFVNVRGSSGSSYAGGGQSVFNGSSWTVFGTLDLAIIVNTNTPAYYFFGRDSTTATTLQACKSTAPDTSWASITSSTGFTTAILNIAGYQSGNVVHLLVQDGTMSSSVATKYVSFDTATDTFLATIETVSAAAILTGTATSGWGCSLVVRSNGEVVAFYNGVQTKVSTNWSRVYYRRRTAVNTYGTETMVDAGLGVNNTAPIAVLGASDRVHFLFFNATNTIQRHLTSANVLGTAASTGATTAVLDCCTFDDAGTTRHVGFTPATAFRWASADNPTVTAAAVTFGTPVRTVNDNTDVYALYQNSADSDLYVKKSTDRGATFDAGTNVFTATVAAADANISKNQMAYQRGSSVMFPYVVNDNGTLKYNEAVVRATAAAAKAMPPLQSPRKIFAFGGRSLR